MKITKKLTSYLLIVLITSFSNQAWSHSAFMSFYKIKQEQDQWSLNVVLAASNVTNTMKNQITEGEYQTKIKSEKQQWLTSYLIANTKIWLNGDPVELKKTEVVLGNHDIQAHFNFALNAGQANKQMNSMDFHITGFAESKNHHNIVLLDAAGLPGKIVLSHLNQFKQRVIRQ